MMSLKPASNHIGPSFRSGPSAAVLRTLEQPHVNLAAWRRTPRRRLSQALATWAARQRVDRFDDVLDVRACDMSVPTQALPPPLRDPMTRDMARLLELFTRHTTSRRVRLCFGAARTDQCRKFHSDYLRYRLICTYAGPGTEWLPDDAVDRDALAHPADCPCDANRAIVRDETAIRHAATFEVLLLKGELHAGGRGAVHRSPPLEAAGRARVVLILSTVED